MKRWEYHTVSNNGWADAFDELGENGWELVGFQREIDDVKYDNDWREIDRSESYLFVFKRELQKRG